MSTRGKGKTEDTKQNHATSSHQTVPQAVYNIRVKIQDTTGIGKLPREIESNLVVSPRKFKSVS